MQFKHISSLLSIGLSLFLLTSCASITSSVEYTKGTQCLQSGDYPAAIKHLEKCVALEPRFSKNQGNLACAYLAVGDVDKAWYHSRKATLGIDPSLGDFYTFTQLSQICVDDKGLSQKGTLLEDALCILGEPDEYLTRDKAEGLVYGCLLLIFEEGKLVEDSMCLPDALPSH